MDRKYSSTKNQTTYPHKIGLSLIIGGHDINSPYPSFFELNIHCNNENGMIFEEIEVNDEFIDYINRIH